MTRARRLLFVAALALVAAIGLRLASSGAPEVAPVGPSASAPAASRNREDPPLSAEIVPGPARSDSVDDAELVGSMDVFGVVRGPEWEPRGEIEITAEVGGKIAGRTLSRTDGVFALGKLPRRPLVVSARASSYALAAISIGRTEIDAYPDRLGPLLFVLEPGTTLEGRVVASDGAPAAGAEVACRFDAAALRAQADAAGRFALAGVPRPRRLAPVRLDAVRAGADGRTESASFDLSGAADAWPPREPIELRLEANPRVKGVVVDRAGQPVEAATVTCAGAIATAEAGRFALALVPGAATPGPVVVTADGYAWSIASPDLRALADSDRELRVELDRGEALGGIVLSETGSPVPRAVVLVEGSELPGEDHERETRRVRAGADGRFRAERLPLRSLAVTAQVPGISSAAVDATPPDSSLEIRLPAAPEGFGSVEGRVVDRASRRPVRDFRLFALSAREPLPVFHPGDGTFRVEHAAAGRMRLRALPGIYDAPAFLPAEREIAVAPGDTRRDVVIEVGGGGSVVVRFVVPITEGGELGAAMAVLDPMRGSDSFAAPISKAADTEGVARFEDVPPGSYRLSLVEGLWALRESMEIRVEPGTAAEVRAVLVPGAPLLVSVQPRGEERTLAPVGIRLIGESGAVVFERVPGSTRAIAGAGARLVVPPGSYVVAVFRGETTLAQQPVKIAAPEGAVVPFAVEAEGPQ
ncbi:MAG TPA: carboxypeptidase-like regulatory domain-containing protein [Planctomycetota bacterium]|nr:carboxypeptidase-like regulatory domain-containing protein [Planctomycetota bacterium]